MAHRLQRATQNSQQNDSHSIHINMCISYSSIPFPYVQFGVVPRWRRRHVFTIPYGHVDLCTTLSVCRLRYFHQYAHHLCNDSNKNTSWVIFFCFVSSFSLILLLYLFSACSCSFGWRVWPNDNKGRKEKSEIKRSKNKKRMRRNK